VSCRIFFFHEAAKSSVFVIITCRIFASSLRLSAASNQMGPHKRSPVYFAISIRLSAALCNLLTSAWPARPLRGHALLPGSDDHKRTFRSKITRVGGTIIHKTDDSGATGLKSRIKDNSPYIRSAKRTTCTTGRSRCDQGPGLLTTGFRRRVQLERPKMVGLGRRSP